MAKLTAQRIIAVLAMTVLMLAFSITSGLAWDMATHAYMEENLLKKSGKVDDAVLYNRIYGSGTIDLFNNVFSDPQLLFANYLHDPEQDNFLKVWNHAASRDEKAFAYGFVGHNNRWGMDSTAHISGRTFGKNDGYVIAKARILSSWLRPALEEQFGQLDDSVVIDLCHYLVESGVDFLVRAKDPEIGNKLMYAALSRSDNAPLLLQKAFKTDFATLAGIDEATAAYDIEAAEATFQYTMLAYGYALAQDDSTALYLVANGMATVGAEYLGLPPEPEIIDVLTEFAQQGILAAMELCAPDIDRELQATTGWLNGRLSSNRIVW